MCIPLFSMRGLQVMDFLKTSYSYGNFAMELLRSRELITTEKEKKM